MNFYPAGDSLFNISPVVVVTRGRKGATQFVDSLVLFRHLEGLASRGVPVTRLEIDGVRVAPGPLNAMTWAHRSLRPFWRVSKFRAYGTKYQWAEFVQDYLHLA